MTPPLVSVNKDDLSRAINLVLAFATDHREPERYRDAYAALAERLQAAYDEQAS